MPHKSNIAAFLLQSQPNPLLDAYRILVSVELALKDAGFFTGQGGHDVPAMLSKAAQHVSTTGHLMLAGQISSHETKLRQDLGQLLTTRENGSVKAVPGYSYPHARYTRFTGDWGVYPKRLCSRFMTWLAPVRVSSRFCRRTKLKWAFSYDISRTTDKQLGGLEPS